MSPEDALALLDWKRQVFDFYASVRADPDPQRAWDTWRAARDELFADHPQSPIPREERTSFSGLSYFDYDPGMRTRAKVTAMEPALYDIATSDETTMGFTRIGRASFELGGRRSELELYWLDGYGGGLFVPFRDATSGGATYGAGRYLLDTIKGADLGTEDGALIFDFNFAYNPSCSYDPRWVCPLAPPPNHLDLAIRAGERSGEGSNSWS